MNSIFRYNLILKAMRRKLEEMLRLAELQVEYDFKKIAMLFRSCSNHEDKAKCKHRANLYTIYIDFIEQKLNKLKIQL